MKKTLFAIFFTLSFFSFRGEVFAQVATAGLTPASPQVYNGISDETLNVANLGATATGQFFNVAGVSTHNAGNGTNQTYASLWTNTFQQDAGSAGDVHWLAVDYTAGDYATACGDGIGTYSACLLSTAYSNEGSIQETFTLTPAPIPPPTPPFQEIFGEASSNNPTVVIADIPTLDLFMGLIILYITMYGIINIFRKK